jgi:hypothetical protein
MTVGKDVKTMSRLSPEAAWRRIVEDTRLPAKSRILALEQIAQPSLNLLRRLLAAKSTPLKLRLLAAQKYEIEISRLAARKEVQAVPGPTETEQDGCASTIDHRIAELCSGIVRLDCGKPTGLTD